MATRPRTAHPPAAKRPPHLEPAGDLRSRNRVFVVGAGRLGTALARSLSLAGWEVEAWSRTPRRRKLPGVTQHAGLLPAGIADAKLVLLTVPDRAIGAVASELAELGLLHRGQVVAHASGALDLRPLAPAAAAGASVGSLHPLVAATPGEVQLGGKWSAVEGDAAAVRLLRRVARAVGLRPFAVSGEARARYHAAASLAANGLVALADLASELLASAGVDRETALEALLPLLQSSLDNLARTGAQGALTGPVARGDAAVVAAHLRELRGDPARNAYRALAARQVEIALQQGSADPAGLERIARLVSAPRSGPRGGRSPR